MSRVNLKRFLQISVCTLEYPKFQAWAGPIHIVLRVIAHVFNCLYGVKKEYYYPWILDIRSLVVLLVEALRAQSVVGEGEAGFNHFTVTAKIQSVVVVWESEVEFLKFSVGITSVDVDSWILRHEIEGLIENSNWIMVLSFLE